MDFYYDCYYIIIKELKMALVDAIWLFPDLWKISLPLSGSAPPPPL